MLCFDIRGSHGSDVGMIHGGITNVKIYVVGSEKGGVSWDDNCYMNNVLDVLIHLRCEANLEGFYKCLHKLI